MQLDPELRLPEHKALREKVEEQPSQPRWILTARGLGYRLAKEESQ